METKYKLKRKKVISRTRRMQLRGEWSDDKVKQLISNVESRPALWEVGGFHPIRPHTWQEVAAELGNGFDARECKLKWQNLRVTYKTNMASLAKRKGEQMSVPRVKWRFFDSMRFITRNEQQNGVLKEENKPLDTELMNLSCLTTTSLQNVNHRRARTRVLAGGWPDAKVSELIKSVQLRPALWKAGIINHRKTRSHIWQEVAEELGKEFDACECKFKWQNLRVTYKTNIAILEKNKFNLNGTNKLCRAKWRFLEAMQFISSNEDVVNNTSDFNKLESDCTSNFYTELTNSSYSTMTSQQNLDNSQCSSFVVKEESPRAIETPLDTESTELHQNLDCSPCTSLVVNQDMELTNASQSLNISQNLDHSQCSSIVIKQESPILMEAQFDTNLTNVLPSTNISQQNLDFSKCSTSSVKQESPSRIETPLEAELTNASSSTTNSQPTVVYPQSKEDNQETSMNVETPRDTELTNATCSTITSEPGVEKSQCSSSDDKQENPSKKQTRMDTQLANASSPKTVRSSENDNSFLLDKQETTRTIQISRLAPYVAKNSRQTKLREKKIKNKNDEHACFGNFIASELRSLPPEHSFALKRRLNRTLLEYWDTMETQNEAATLPQT